MTRLGVILAVILALGAYQVRVESPVLEASRQAQDVASSTVLRRVQLALAGGEISQFDRFIAAPEGAAYREPASRIVALAVIAQELLGQTGPDPAASAVPERELQDLLAQVPPVLGAVLTLLAFLYVRVLLGPTGVHSALLAAVLCTFSQLALGAQAISGFGSLELVAVLGLMLMILSVQIHRSRDSLDLLQSGISAGLVAGLALITTPIAVLVVPVVWGTFWARTKAPSAGDAPEARGPVAQAAAIRGGLFFSLVTVVVTTFAANGLAEGARGSWESAISEFCLLAGTPFVIRLLRMKEANRPGLFRGLRYLTLLTVICLLPFSAVRVAQHVVSATLGAAGVDLFHPLEDGVGLLLVVAASLVLLRRSRFEERSLVLVALACTAVLVALPEALTLAVALSSVVLAVAWNRWCRSGVSLPAALLAMGLMVLFSTPIVFGGREPQAVLSRSGVEALRWLRTQGDPTGPWNVAQARPSYSVLAPGDLAALVRFHGRRGTSSNGQGDLSEERTQLALAALWADEPGGLAETMSRLGARYLVAGSAACEQLSLGPQSAGALPSIDQTVLWELSHGLSEEAGQHFERVHASADGRSPDASGGLASTEVVLYRLKRLAEGPQEQTVLRPR